MMPPINRFKRFAVRDLLQRGVDPNAFLFALQFQFRADDPIFFVNFQPSHPAIFLQKTAVQFRPDFFDLCSPRQHSENNNFNRIHQTTAHVEEITELHGIEYESSSVVQQVHKISTPYYTG